MTESNNYKCETCKENFEEDFIFYKCKECGKYYCFTCFCKNHFNTHETGWIEYKIKNKVAIELKDPTGPIKVK